MALALDQSLGQGNTTGSNTCNMTTGAAIASGAIVVMAMAHFRAGSTTDITASGGGLTWTTDQFVVSGNIKIAFASAKVSSGLASGATFTATGVPSQASDWIIGAGSFLGIDTSGTILTGFASSSGTGTTHSSGSVTANAGDLLVEAAFQDGSGTATGSETAPAVLLFNKTVAGQTEALVFTYELGMSATDSIGGTWSTSVTHVDAGASYLAAAGGGGTSQVNAPSFQAIPFMGGH